MARLMRFIYGDVAKEVALRAASAARSTRSLKELREFMELVDVPEEAQERVLRAVRKFRNQPAIVAGVVLAILDEALKTRRDLRDLKEFTDELERRLGL